MTDQFKVGDRVRLKDSPYEGVIEVILPHKNTRVKLPDGTLLWISRQDLLELVAVPAETGDIYVDKNDFEWIIREYASRRSPGMPDAVYTIAQLIDVRPRNGEYPRAAFDITKPANFQRWVQEYRPTLFRRRGQ